MSMNPKFFMQGLQVDVPKVAKIQEVFRIKSPSRTAEQEKIHRTVEKFANSSGSPDAKSLDIKPRNPMCKKLVQKITKACSVIREGEDFLAAKQYSHALGKYKVAVTIIGENFPLIRCQGYQRMVDCLMKMEPTRPNLEKVVEYSGRILMTDKNNLPILRIRSKVYKRLGKLEELVNDLAHLNRLCPDDRKIGAALRKYHEINRNKEPENLYEFLGVSSTATEKEIIKKCKKMKIKHHPDRAGEDEFEKKKHEEMFKKIGEAEETLTDNVKRQRYDADLADGACYTSSAMGGGGGGGGGGGMNQATASSFFQNSGAENQFGWENDNNNQQQAQGGGGGGDQWFGGNPNQQQSQQSKGGAWGNFKENSGNSGGGGSGGGGDWKSYNQGGGGQQQQNNQQQQQPQDNSSSGNWGGRNDEESGDVGMGMEDEEDEVEGDDEPKQQQQQQQDNPWGNNTNTSDSNKKPDEHPSWTQQEGTTWEDDDLPSSGMQFKDNTTSQKKKEEDKNKKKKEQSQQPKKKVEEEEEEEEGTTKTKTKSNIWGSGGGDVPDSQQQQQSSGEIDNDDHAFFNPPDIQAELEWMALFMKDRDVYPQGDDVGKFVKFEGEKKLADYINVEEKVLKEALNNITGIRW